MSKENLKARKNASTTERNQVMTNTATAITASDIMQRDVVATTGRDSLREAMQLITENHVTGLPVMNAKDRCIGIITSTDILNYEQEHAEFTSEANADMASHFDCDTQQWESVRVTSFALEEFGDVPVEDVMSRDLIYVNPDAPIIEVAKKMCEENIHRVMVLSDDSRLYGIISSFDFVKLLSDTI